MNSMQDSNTAGDKRTHPLHYPPMPVQVHLSDYLAILKRWKWTMMLLFALIVGGTSWVSLQMTPMYRATAKVMIEQQTSPYLDLKSQKYSRGREEDFYQTQYNLLRSKSLAGAVIEKLAIEKQLNLQSSSAKNLIGSDALASLNLNTAPDPDKNDPSWLVDWYLSRLRITPLRSTHLVNIGFQNHDPNLAARIANAHAKAAVTQSIEIKRNSAQQAHEWLIRQLETQKAEIEATQQAIYKYKKENDIISLEGRQNIVAQNLIALNSALTSAKAERMAKQTVADQLKSYSVDKDKLFSLPEFSRDSIILNLRNRIFEMKAKALEMATRYGPKHPKMIKLRSGIVQLNQEISGEVDRAKKTINTELNRAKALERSLKRSLDAQKKLATSLEGKITHYEMLRTRAQGSQSLYNTLLKQSKEVALVRELNASNIRIVDRAEIPRFPIKPRILMNILLSIVLGLFLSTATAFFFEYMDNTVKTREDLTRRLNLPALGALPYNKMLRNKRAAQLPSGKKSPDRKRLALVTYPMYEISSRFPFQIPFFKEATYGHVFLIESATGEEGKTTVLGNLGMNMAAAGFRTLLIDYDLHRPRVHQLFGLKNSSGLLNAAHRIMSFDLSNGKLKECSMDDLFFLIALKKISGVLLVKNESQAQTMAVYFQDGRLLHIQSQNMPESSRLGTMLLNGNFINQNQLKDALERQGRTGQPLGYILINAGYIQRDRLQGPIRLQTEEHLQKLFSWKTGTYTFKPGRATLYNTEKVAFGEDFTRTIEGLGRLEGSRLIENEIVSRIFSTAGDNLCVMPAGTALSELRGPVNLSIIAKFLEILKQRFDVILIDTPPLDAATGVVALSKLVDGVLLVVKAGHLSVKKLNQAFSTISRDKIIGAVLNQTKLNKGDYNYKYYK